MAYKSSGRQGRRSLCHEPEAIIFLVVMSKHLASVLTTVNVPYGMQLDDVELAHCLADLDVAKLHPDHVSAFLGEIPAALQIKFAAEHDVPIAELKVFATAFSAWSGENYPLAA